MTAANSLDVDAIATGGGRNTATFGGDAQADALATGEGNGAVEVGAMANGGAGSRGVGNATANASAQSGGDVTAAAEAFGTIASARASGRTTGLDHAATVRSVAEGRIAIANSIASANSGAATADAFSRAAGLIPLAHASATAPASSTISAEARSAIDRELFDPASASGLNSIAYVNALPAIPDILQGDDTRFADILLTAVNTSAELDQPTTFTSRAELSINIFELEDPENDELFIGLHDAAALGDGFSELSFKVLREDSLIVDLLFDNAADAKAFFDASEVLTFGSLTVDLDGTLDLAFELSVTFDDGDETTALDGSMPSAEFPFPADASALPPFSGNGFALLAAVGNSAAAIVPLALELAGDYNGNGTVDAADYTVWRNSLGQADIGLAADGNGDNLVDASDLDVWKTHFGETASSSSEGVVQPAAAVPEPAAFMLLMMAFIVLFGGRATWQVHSTSMLVGAN